MQADLPASIESWICTLQKCRQEKNLAFAKRFHVHLCQQQLELHPVLANYLIPMLVQCGALPDAHQAFCRLPQHHRNLHSWNCLILSYIDHGNPQQAFLLYHQMQVSPRTSQPDSVTYLALLTACSRLKFAERGQQVHAEIIRRGLERDTFDSNEALGNTLVDMYAKCGLLGEAKHAFEWLPVKDAVSWAALIAGYAERGLCEDIGHCLRQLFLEGPCPDTVMFVCILKACGTVQALEPSQEIHTQTTKRGYDRENYVGNTLVDIYGKLGLLAEAHHVFILLLARDVVSWNALINGYAEHGLGEEAVKSLRKMMEEGICPDSVTFICCLKACSAFGTAAVGQQVHAEAIKWGIEKELFVGSTLLDMYTRFGLLTEACLVFDGLLVRDAAAWNTLVAGYAECGSAEQSISCYEQLLFEVLAPDSVTFASCLKACINAGALQIGKDLHAQTVKMGVERDHNVSSLLIEMYIECGLLLEARRIIDSLSIQDAITWNALIAGYADNGLGGEVRSCLNQMLVNGISPDSATFACILKACASRQALAMGQEIHVETTKKGLETELYAGSELVNLYSECGLLAEACHVFDGLVVRNTVAWNVMIAGYVECGLAEEVEHLSNQLLLEGVSPDAVTFGCRLKACVTIQASEVGQEIHAETIKRGCEREIFVNSLLVAMYCECDLLAEAHHSFENLLVQCAVGGTTYKLGGTESENTCQQMLLQESSTLDPTMLVWSLKACISIGALDIGQKLHGEMTKCGLERELYMDSTLVEMYIDAGLLAEARYMIDQLRVQNIGSWNALIAGYTEHGLSKEVEGCYQSLLLEGTSPNSYTFVSSLKACSTIQALETGKHMHAETTKRGLEKGIVIGNMLVDMYSKCASLAEAINIFDGLPARDEVACAAIIAGYTEHGLGEQASRCFQRMQIEGIFPDAVVFISTLKACSFTGSLEMGRDIHAEIAKRGLERDLYVGSTLLDMYGKCGSLAEAWRVFEMLPVRSVASWTAMIQAFGKNHEGNMAMKCFENMKKQGVMPNDITFVSLLAACSHSSLVPEGHGYFKSMASLHEHKPTYDHCACIIDLFARAGQICEAEKVAAVMKCRPSNMMLYTLLSACVFYGDEKVGQRCFEQLVEH